MSLDVYLISKTPVTKKGTGVFVREAGGNRELTVSEVMEKYPNSVVGEVEYETENVYDANITHNLRTMAEEAGIYNALWRPYRLKKDYVNPFDYIAEGRFEDQQTIQASELIESLEKGLADLKARPEHFEQFNSPNGWGMYEHFVPFVEKYLNACKEYPEAIVSVSR